MELAWSVTVGVCRIVNYLSYLQNIRLSKLGIELMNLVYLATLCPNALMQGILTECTMLMVERSPLVNYQIFCQPFFLNAQNMPMFWC